MTTTNPNDLSEQIAAAKKLRKDSLLRAQSHQMEIINTLGEKTDPLSTQEQYQLTAAQETYDHLAESDLD